MAQSGPLPEPVAAMPATARKLRPVRWPFWAIWFGALAAAAFLVTAKLLPEGSPARERESGARIDPERVKKRPPQAATAAQRERALRLGRALRAIAEARQNAPAAPPEPAAPTLPIPGTLGKLQEIALDDSPEARRAATHLRKQARVTLQRTVFPCWAKLTDVHISLAISARIRRVGNDFELLDMNVQELTGEPFGPEQRRCLESRLAKRRLVNGRSAVWTLAPDFESTEVFRISVDQMGDNG